VQTCSTACHNGQHVARSFQVRSSAAKIATSVKYHRDGRGRIHMPVLLALHLLTHHKSVLFCPCWSSTIEPSKQCEKNRTLLRKLFLSMSFDPSRQWIRDTWSGQVPGTLAVFVKLFADSEVRNSKKHRGSNGTACGTETAWIPPRLLQLHKY